MKQHLSPHTGMRGTRWMRFIPVLIMLLAFFGSAFRLSAQVPQEAARHLTFTLQYTLRSNEPLKSEDLTVVLPQTWDGRQQVLSQTFSPKEGVKVFTRDGRAYATFHLDNPRKSEAVVVTTEANLFRDDLTTVQQNPPQIVKPEAAMLAPFLQQENLIEVNAAPIQVAAKSISGATDVEIVQQIMTYVKSHVHFAGNMTMEMGALRALLSGQGDCSEYSTLFVALCRAKGIPARRCTGFLTNESLAPSKFFHAWVEAYLDNYGWVPFDPAMSNSPSVVADPRVYLTNLEIDPVMNGDHAGYCLGLRKNGNGFTQVWVEMEVRSRYN